MSDSLKLDKYLRITAIHKRAHITPAPEVFGFLAETIIQDLWIKLEYCVHKCTMQYNFNPYLFLPHIVPHCRLSLRV